MKIEVFPLQDPVGLTEADLEEDHFEAVSQMLRDSDDSTGYPAIEPTEKKFRFDLCPDCRAKFIRDPLGREPAQSFDFSEN